MPDCYAPLDDPFDARALEPRTPSWLAALRGRDGLMVLREAMVPAPWGVERLPAVVLHRRGGVIVEARPVASVACLREGATAESPCMPVLDAHRRVALLRRHVARRARRLFPHRLLPGRFAAGLSFEALVVVEPAPRAAASGATCAGLVASPEALARRIDLLAHPSDRAGSVLRAEDMTLLAADLSAPQAPEAPEAWYRPLTGAVRTAGASG